MSESESIKSSKSDIPDRVIARNFPKSIYLYPSMLAGFILWGIDFMLSSSNNYPTGDVNISLFKAYLASAWMFLFLFNIIVISFDFSLGKTFTIFITIAFVLLVYFVAKEAIFPEGLGFDLSLKKVMNDFNISATPNFYLSVSLILFFVLLIVFIASRFNYWEFESNRIVHHRGIFEREESFSAQRSRVITQTDDIFERILFRAGTIFIIDPDGRVHKLSNVYNAIHKDKMIQKLLSVVRVKEE